MRPKPDPVRTPRLADAARLLRDFRFIDPFWSGRAPLPCWGGQELSVNIDPEGAEADISSRQLDVLCALLEYPSDLRPAFERALFRYYQSDVEGSYCAYDPATNGPVPGSGPPELTDPPQVWRLIDEAEVFIHWIFRTRAAVEFELSFNCEWDREHGLGVLYRNWKPVEFGGWDL